MKLHTGSELPAVALHDEERVVDSNREAKHHSKNRGDGCHLHNIGEGQRSGDANSDTNDRRNDGKHGRQECAEKDEQDEPSQDHTDDFTDTEKAIGGVSDRRRVVNLNTRDIGILELRCDRALELSRHIEKVDVERDEAQSRRPIVGDCGDVGCRLHEALAIFELLLVLFDRRSVVIDRGLLLIDLCHAGINLGLLSLKLRYRCVVDTGCFSLFDRSIELRLTGLQLLLRRIQLRLTVNELLFSGSDLIAAVREFLCLFAALSIRFEGINNAADVVERGQVFESCGDLLALLGGELVATFGGENDCRGCTAHVSDSITELCRDPVCLSARNRHR